MTAPWLNEDAVTTALVDVLRAGVAPIPVGDGKRPDGLAADATYLVVNQIASGAPIGGKADPEGTKWLKYQITAIGRQRNAAGLALDRALRVVLGRDTDRGYTTPIVADGAQVTGRRSTLSLSGADNDYTKLAHIDLLASAAPPAP